MWLIHVYETRTLVNQRCAMIVASVLARAHRQLPCINGGYGKDELTARQHAS